MTQGSTVLIVDDQLSAREVLRGLLTGQGYNLMFATNGEEALAVADSVVPDIILLDVMMPGMDGFEVCERLRSNPRLAEVPVLLLTALDDRESRLRGFNAGADDFISKPFDQIELRTRIHTITKLNRYRRLHTERAKFEWAIEKGNYAYLIINQAHQITYANEHARLYLSLTGDEALPTTSTFVELARKQGYHLEPSELWSEWPILSSQTDAIYLVKPANDYADSLWLQVDALEMPLDENQRYLVHLSDVTSEITTKRMMWTFHSQVGHKLRTPIMLITGFLDVLNEDLEAVSVDYQPVVASAYKNAVRLQNEIQDVLQYLETPHLAKYDEAACPINTILELIEKVKSLLGLEKVDCDFSHLPPPIQAGAVILSERSMEVILTEILENAKKFHPDQSPTVIITATQTNSDQLTLLVTDDGISLPPQELLKIWNPYYQIEKYFTGQIAGMGLGLATVSGLVWDVGGACSAYNRPDGTGLVIELSIPLAADE